MEQDLIFEFFASMPRQGPGATEYTLRALESLRDRLPADPRILDIGCGNGVQTCDLFTALPSAHITAIDVHQPFLAMLSQKCRELQNVTGKVETRLMSMDELDFDKSSFDLIWSEGAIYIIGFHRGIFAWKDYLKPGGFMVVSEAVWIKPDPPSVVKEFWETEYPEIGTVEEKLRIITQSGLKAIHHFTLPGSVWTDEFYHPMQDVISNFPASKRNVGMADFLLEMQHEIEMFKKYGDYYSYEFFIMQKTS